MSITVYTLDKSVSDIYATLNEWVAAIGSTEVQVEIGDDWTISADLTIPDNIDISRIKYPYKISGAYTLKIGKMSARPMHKIFDDNVTVQFRISAVEYVLPHWFGGAPVDAASPVDLSAAIQRAINATPQGGTIRFPGQSTEVDGSVDKRYYANGLTVSRTISIVGDSLYNSTIFAYNDSADILTVYPAAGTNGFKFQDIAFAGRSKVLFTKDCIVLKNVINSTFNRVHVGTCRYGILEAQGAWVNYFNNYTNCIFGSECDVGLYLSLQAQSFARVEGCLFDENWDHGLLVAGSQNVIVGNTFVDTSESVDAKGIHLEMVTASARNVINGNVFNAGTGYGAARAIISRCDYNVITGNGFRGPWGTSSEPILLTSDAHENIIAGNYSDDKSPIVNDALEANLNTVINSYKNRHIYSAITDDTIHQVQAKSAKFSTNIASTDSTTGTLVVGGGLGVAGDVNLASELRVGTKNASAATKLARISSARTSYPILNIASNNSGAADGDIVSSVELGIDETSAGYNKYASIRARIGADTRYDVGLVFGIANIGGTNVPKAHLWASGGVNVGDDCTSTDPGSNNLRVKGKISSSGLSTYANNAAAISGGLVAGDFYRTGGDPDTVCVVH